MSTFDNLLFLLILFAALGCGLMAGLFFAFSFAVMRALARLPAAVGIAAMQSINTAIINPLFGLVFMGTAAACILVTLFTLFRWHNPGGVYLLTGSLLYLVGSFLVTMVFNVPKNNALAAVEAADPSSSRLWADYVRSWTAWNHVRMTAALAAAALLTIGLCY